MIINGKYLGKYIKENFIPIYIKFWKIYKRKFIPIYIKFGKIYKRKFYSNLYKIWENI